MSRVDAFQDVTPDVRISGGPRVSFATDGYFDTYYGVNAQQSAASGLSRYDPGGGMELVGIGGAITWKATDNITASLFSEYSRLIGSAAEFSSGQAARFARPGDDGVSGATASISPCDVSELGALLRLGSARSAAM